MINLLCLNSGSAAVGGHIWRPITPQHTQRLCQFGGSSKCSPQMQPSFTSFWRMHCDYPLISQDSWQVWAAEIMTLTVGAGMSGDATRKCSEGQTVPFNNGWCGLRRSLLRNYLRRLQRPGLSKDADPELGHSQQSYLCFLTVPVVRMWQLYTRICCDVPAKAVKKSAS